jgi:hypothetical protein
LGQSPLYRIAGVRLYGNGIRRHGHRRQPVAAETFLGFFLVVIPICLQPFPEPLHQIISCNEKGLLPETAAGISDNEFSDIGS